VNDAHEHITFVFFAKAKTDKLNLSDTEVSGGCRWFSMDDLESDKEIHEQIRFYAKKALEAFSGK
jgi:hypothetical protein